MKFKDIDIDLQALDIIHDNVALLQMNPENPDEHKINSCDMIIVDGYAIKKGALKDVLRKAMKLVR